MEARSVRAELRRELSKQLLPELERRGFIGPERIGGHATCHEFVRLREGAKDQLTIQLEKYGRPRFIVILSIEPPDGFDRLIQAGGVAVAGIVRPRPGSTTRTWFRADPGVWARIMCGAMPTPKRAVAQCVDLLPEIDNWWHSREPSSHIRVRETHFPGTPASGR